MFNVRFQGLITHAQIDGQWVAIFFNEPGHAVRLAVEDGDWIAAETDVPPVGTGDRGLTCFPLSGSMRLLNVKVGQVTAHLAGVPHLKQISDGDEPRTEIRNRTPHGDFVGYLEIDGGLLTIEDWYEKTVTFDGVKLQCLPRTVLLSVNTTQEKVILYLDGKKITMRSDATVTIRNMDRVNPTPGEYQFYKRFFRNATYLQQPTETNVPCSFGSPEGTPKQCGEGRTLGVECSNNQYP